MLRGWNIRRSDWSVRRRGAPQSFAPSNFHARRCSFVWILPRYPCSLTPFPLFLPFALSYCSPYSYRPSYSCRSPFPCRFPSCCSSVFPPGCGMMVRCDDGRPLGAACCIGPRGPVGSVPLPGPPSSAFYYSPTRPFSTFSSYSSYSNAR
eukprot:GHVT01061874.1.p1 GENE.GHVT01061874.1~~GHVT01061874.1.p1  ORF type:complete len:150 (+),score=11.66 GHVT01061874.1:804-1253(+)